MNRETSRIPKLVDESYFKVPEVVPKVKKSVTFQTIPKNNPSGSHSIPSGSHSIPSGSHSNPSGSKNITNNKARNSLILNLVILFIFIGFFIFFLYNCKYGMFKNIEIDPVPFSIVSGVY